MNKIENIASFEKRVLCVTGIALADLEQGEPDDALHHIVVKRGDVYVVWDGEGYLRINLSDVAMIAARKVGVPVGVP